MSAEEYEESLLRFPVFGPYWIPRISRRRKIDFDRARDDVFEEANPEARTRFGIDLTKAVGCYIFGLATTQRLYPYYVGQACRQTLYRRVFQETDKPALYNDILARCGYERVSPFVFLLPLLTRGRSAARLGSNQRIINNAEHTLIGLARAANWDLWNLKHRAGMDAFYIDGAFNSDRRVSGSACKLREMLDLERERERS